MLKLDRTVIQVALDFQTLDESLRVAEMAVKAAETGVKKTALDTVRMFLLAVLAGSFIAMGAIFATTVSAGSSVLPYGVARLLAGVAFT